jgi:serine/threonine-protein kinase RsbW
MNESIVVRIEAQAQLLFLRPLDSFVRNLLEQLPGLTDDHEMVNNLELAFNEAFANIYEHAYGSDRKGPVIIEIRISPHEIQFQFEDFGEGFDPSTLIEPDLERPLDGGLGVWLIRHFMDEYIYSREDNTRNILRLVKKLPSNAFE